MPKTASAPLLMARPPAAHTAPSLMDDRQFMAELETMEVAPKPPAPKDEWLEHVHQMDDGFVPRQPGLHVPASERSHTTRPRAAMQDRNAFQPAPLEPDEAFDRYRHDDETSVTFSARVAAFAITASGLAGAGAAALVFHARLAQFLH
jgi:hypothetical protein